MLITNLSEENSLWSRLDHLIAESEEMRVLVGFFYFWGIGALHEGISRNPSFRLKILVGLQAEPHAGKLVEFAAGIDPEATDEECRADFLDSLRSVMRSGEIDTRRFYDRVSLFVELLRSGRIEIRKTREPNHAKLYHFSLNASFAAVLNRKYCWITGSSNLTRPGLVEQNELNVQLLDFGGQETKTFFDALWARAVPLTDDPETRTRILELVGGDESLLANVTPFEAYALVLKHYLEHRELIDRTPTIERVFAEPEDEDGAPKYRPLRFQIDAINQALSILRGYNGVIVADVAGLGKSVIASVLGRVNARRGIVIAPPGLVGDPNPGTGWWGYLEDFGLNDWKAISRGKMEEVLTLVNRQRDFEVVVVDEAHYFRNQDSEDYHYLSQICRGRQVVLLTATPYSNRPNDMLSLLKLFSPARQSLLTPDGDLEGLFRAYQARYLHMDYALKNLENPELEDKVQARLLKLGILLDLAPANYPVIRSKIKTQCRTLGEEIRRVLEPVMIRRNRLDLKGDPEYAAELTHNLPTMHDPVEQFYALSPEQSAFYDRVIRDYFGRESQFTGAIYQPGAYVPDAEDPEWGEEDGSDARTLLNNQQRNMYKFIRRLLVRRFESSFGAFAKTLDNLIHAHQSVLRLATPQPSGRGLVVLDRNLMDKLLNLGDAADDEINDLLERYRKGLDSDRDLAGRKNVQVFRVSEDFDKEGQERFFHDLRADIDLLKKVKRQVEKLDLVANDPKARRLIDEIRAVLDGTHPECVNNPDEPERKVLVFTEFGDTVNHLQAYLDRAFPGRVLTIRSLGKETAQTVRHNFDGSCNPTHWQDRFKVLLATDKMSEGFNLNRAGLVINYDIPWNPTRVIQRVGRINRIGTKVFDDLYLFNFFPTEQGRDAHNVKLIATTKMFMIHTSIGEDAKIFETDEEPTPAGLFEKLSRNPDELEEESFLTRAKREWAAICKNHPQVAGKVARLPGRVKTTTFHDPAGAYLFARKGTTLFALRKCEADDIGDGIVHLSIQDAMREIECPFDTERARDFSETFWENYEALQDALSDRRHGSPPGSTSLFAKARNVLSDMTARGIGGNFTQTLLDDLLNLGTLSDRTLRKIIDASGSEHRFQEIIEQLEKEMGAHYLDALKQTLPPNEIVIAIEHQAQPHLLSQT